MNKIQAIPAKIPLAIFLISAGISVWASYDLNSALAKFTQLFLAVIIYFILAAWPGNLLHLIARLGAGLTAFLALYFLFTADWSQSPADVAMLTRLGLAWMDIRPALPDSLPRFHPNIAGGLLAALIPLGLAGLADAWRKRHNAWLVYGLLAIVLSAAGLLMTSSRAAWFALALGLGAWLWWKASQPISRRLRIQPGAVFFLPVILALGGAAFLAWGEFTGFLGVVDGLPQSASMTSRVEIFWNALHLARDYYFTGGGLAAFSGLYSEYMLLFNVFEFGYAHNLYLDLLVEQGIFGLGAFLWIALVGMEKTWQAMTRATSLAAPVMAGLLVMLFHGIFDDPFYGMGGTSLLFVMPGLAAALSEPVTQAQPRRLFDLGSNGLFLGILGVEIVALVLLPANRSGAYANLGAVEMARLELAGWSDKAQNKTALFESPAQPVPDLFLKALEIDPTNASALYRLGMIAMENGDFTQARDYLEAANLSSPAHRGIRKLLGYSYTWLDQTEAAVTALRPIPEAAQELGYYAWWWGTQNKPDLSEYARKVHERLRMP